MCINEKKNKNQALTLEIPGPRGLGSEPFVALFLNEISKIQKVVQKISKWSQDLVLQ